MNDCLQSEKECIYRMSQEKNKALRRRRLHRLTYRLIARPYAKWAVRRYQFRVDNAPSREVLQKPSLILSNHVSQFDKNFMIAALPRQAYFVATEDLFCRGLLSRALRFLFDPIPLFKPDMSTAPVRRILRRVRWKH